MKILIADDEKIARVTLKSMLSDLNFPMIIYEASDGEMLLEKVKEYYPEIAFVDIKMPKLDGLNAIKKATLLSPHTKWIILTAYSEFDFAKEAVELKVFKYLLKPVNPQKLAGTMEEAVAAYRQDIAFNNVQFERTIINIYNNPKAEHSLSCPYLDINAILQGGIIYLDGNDQNNCQIKKNELFNKSKILAEEYLDNNIRIALFTIGNEKIVTVCAYSLNNDLGSKERINAYFIEVNNLIKLFVSPSLSVTLVRGEIFNIKDDLSRQMMIIEEYSPLRVLFGKSVNYLLSLRKDERFMDYLSVCRSFIELCEYFNQQKYLHYQDTVKYLINELNIESLLANKEFMDNITNFLFLKTNIHIKEGISIRSWLDALINYEDNLIIQDKKNFCYIDEIITYIEENYMNDIGINTIALALNLSPNYLSSIFHKKTKKRFTDYLTEVRIAKAKELLRETDLHVKDIAQKVGYYSTRHFTKLFFKYVNCCPSDYKEILKNKRIV